MENQMQGVNHDSSVHKRVKIGPDARCPIVKGRNKSEILYRQGSLIFFVWYTGNCPHFCSIQLAVASIWSTLKLLAAP